MRVRPLVVLSVTAVSLLALAGCSSSGGDSATPTPTSAAADLCDVAVGGGAASDSIQVSGEVGQAPTVSFTSPLDVTDLESTVITEGTGPAIASGDYINYAVTAYDVSTGAQVDAAGYQSEQILPQQITAGSVLGQVLGCAPIGTRVAATFPASDQSAAAVYVIDLLSITPTAAWGEDQAPTAGFPEVALDDDGAPTITVPDADAPTDVQIETLKKGDGAEVLTGDTVLVQYTGVKWSDGSVFDSSWQNGAPVSFQTTQVVDGFRQALEGQTVGSQVVVVVPPAFGYGSAEGNELQNETLVFVVDILATQHPIAG
ncbi:FKBP-type peptidyl-prolyl cis-trans isomerase [Microbacterium sp. cx-55]|uniref:FKBP-type peptidyl-prolyl cis-trans isomerase n=1 Tax=unclassified Microbacterium TaxID=2609290 RepID=UPI001CC089F3|nr:MULTISPECIES: FKBP-type peptidyl-prolyl cis-trans isomerase [unclassified Microbacterium]MBZ4488535.1 FKBP-type peptidyl-prolyl cis-trans isomerase [Microbacterium sp. cx-55]MCC4909678.1 FKBP-type peptidyl-prolyl cis-trans isomerase [Microbacterium sp. cx-59]UGB36119.1 FKBP-type peptidyl-prolyl cis-trans isomerase [Microbacterium sp. cx-55]